MKCTVSFEHEATHFAYEPDITDSEVMTRASVANYDFTVYRNLEHSHPDIIGLISIFGIAPWVGDEIDSNVAVSPHFADAVASSLRFDMVNIDANIARRARPTDGKVGVAYSGGADCTAAMALLRNSANAYFLDRVTRLDEEWKGVYRKEAAYNSIARLGEHIDVVRSVKTDLEFVRSPVGFPDDFSNIIPALTYADEDRLNAVGWGSVLESMYRVGKRRFRDYRYSPVIRDYRPVFEAVGLSVVNAVAGVSEVGTALINRMSGFSAFAQSCMRGNVGAPCRRCWKCARKILIDSALTDKWPSGSDLDALLTSREARMRLAEEPITLEVTLAFSVNRYKNQVEDRSIVMDALAEKLASHHAEYLQRHYPPALDLLPKEYSRLVSERLQAYLDPMTASEQENVRNWSADPHLNSSHRHSGSDRVARALALLDERPTS